MHGRLALFRVSSVCAFLLLGTPLLCEPGAQTPCEIAAREERLPVTLKTRGKPPRARWEQIDQVLTRLRERLAEISCRFRFNKLFRTREKDLYIPLTNNLIRTVPGAALQGLPVFNQDGERLGEYLSPVTYERSGGLYASESYTLYYFQFRDREGKIQSSGHRLLLDDFLVRWDDLQERTVFGASEP